MVLWPGSCEVHETFSEKRLVELKLEPVSLVEVIKTGKATLLRLNLITTEQLLAPGRKLRYTFGLQATPLRPLLPQLQAVHL